MSGRRGRHDRAGTSLQSRGHLPGNEQVDLSPVVFIVGETFVNLGPGQLRKAVRPQSVNSLAILKQANDVVHGNPSALHHGVPAPHTRRTDNVTVGFRNRVHTRMVRVPSWGVNRSAAGDPEGVHIEPKTPDGWIGPPWIRASRARMTFHSTRRSNRQIASNPRPVFLALSLRTDGTLLRWLPGPQSGDFQVNRGSAPDGGHGCRVHVDQRDGIGGDRNSAPQEGSPISVGERPDHYALSWLRGAYGG